MTLVDTDLRDEGPLADSKDGWAIFFADCRHHAPFEIQMLDINDDDEGDQLDDDEQAWRIVIGKAAGGSALHLRTLAFLALESPEELVGILYGLFFGYYRTFIGPRGRA